MWETGTRELPNPQNFMDSFHLHGALEGHFKSLQGTTGIRVVLGTRGDQASLLPPWDCLLCNSSVASHSILIITNAMPFTRRGHAIF